MQVQATAILLLIQVGSLAAAVPIEASESVVARALAVAETPEGLVGTTATIEARALAGSGRVFVATRPLAQEDMQGSARLAAQVAAHTLNLDWRDYDFLVSFTSDSTVIGGPSAGGVMALALTVALHNLVEPEDTWALDPNVAATGTINPDGTIGPVGGIPAKAEGAAAAGITTFLFPAGLEQASTQTVVRGRLQTVVVDMQEHCNALHITCRPAATLTEVLAEAVGVALDVPTIALPGTVDYAAVLGPSVTASVTALDDRIVLSGHHDQLTAEWTSDVQGYRDDASNWSATAHTALAAGEYYAAATFAFRGTVSIGRAENLTTYYLAGRTPDVVESALKSCDDDVMESEQTLLSNGDSLNLLYAHGAAQVRALEAGRFAQYGHQAYDQAATYAQLREALLWAPFCSERAVTSQWWNALADAFGPGPDVDLDEILQQSFDQALEMLTYAGAVGADTTAAQTAFQNAITAREKGALAGAVILAIDSQTLASLSLQTIGGQPVPPKVMEAAQQSAAHAVAQARLFGAEPVLAVSLIELSASQDDEAALQSLWMARSLALLNSDDGDVPQTRTRQTVGGQGSSTTPNNLNAVSADGVVVKFVALGLSGGLALATLLAFILVLRR